MVGHSLGAHLCGYAGDYLKRRWRLTVGRITGLDPAEPHFEWAHPVTRLDEGDAYFVDVIHTDSNPMLSFGLGMHQVAESRKKLFILLKEMWYNTSKYKQN